MGPDPVRSSADPGAGVALSGDARELGTVAKRCDLILEQPLSLSPLGH